MKACVFFVLLSVLFNQVEGDEKLCSLLPPKGWEAIEDPNQLPKKIRHIYIGKGTTTFTPSLNIACEETALPLIEYIKQAKSYHEKARGSRCAPLGQLNTKVGMAQVLQIDRNSQWGPIRCIQATLIVEGVAYVITSTCLKQEFAAFSSQLFKSIQSFQLE